MTNSLELKGQVAIVTGGGTGIGLAIATEIAKAGADLVVASRNKEHLEKAAGEITGLGRQCLVVPTDIRKAEEVDHLLERTMERFGQIDILVNNAGGSFSCPPEEITPNGWDAVISINLRGTFLCCRAAGKVMIRQRKGNIINIASIAGRDAAPSAVHDGAAKAGVISLTKSLSAAWAKHNIRVNCIAPGPVATEGFLEVLQKKGLLRTEKDHLFVERWGKPVEIARVAVFLASESSRYVAGQAIYVDGGLTLDATLKGVP
jgi:NAD(P)-dependent dehydrogenase (short-subunit alcohol dehydrogenase family)